MYPTETTAMAFMPRDRPDILVDVVGPRLICACLRDALRPLPGIGCVTVAPEPFGVPVAGSGGQSVLLLVDAWHDTCKWLQGAIGLPAPGLGTRFPYALPPVVLLSGKDGVTPTYRNFLRSHTERLVMLDLDCDTSFLHQAVLEASGNSTGRASAPEVAWSGPYLLSERQREVAALAAAGLSNAQIGQRLSIDVTTVKTHLSDTYRKMGVQRRSQIALRLPVSEYSHAIV